MTCEDDGIYRSNLESAHFGDIRACTLSQHRRNWSASSYGSAPMRILLVSIVLLLAGSASGGNDREAECKKIKQKISRIHSKMRSGYTRAEGEKLEAELRRLRALRRKACR